ncbi:uracil-DNA glycosylase family protein, partial [Halococcus sp. IIIV-5B]|uniref:uracil-DNA glycosylase n=1 Tax=Halococcus sp. IIIV-5B TaxID=2321230 RepID=UPI000EC5E0B7
MSADSDEGETNGLDVTACERCPDLCDSRNRIVNGTGPEDAEVVFVGEGPGEQEDRVGRSGSVLDDALRDAGLARRDVRSTNCVRCRPPENRDPHTEELDNCRGYLETEISGIDPEVVVTLGKVPSQHLLGRDVAVTKEAGDIEEVRFAGAAHRVLVCVHPAATLYDSSQQETFRRTIATAAEFGGAG